MSSNGRVKGEVGHSMAFKEYLRG